MKINPLKLVPLLAAFSTILTCSAQNVITTRDLDLDGDVTAWYDNEAGLENTTLYMGSLKFTEQKAEKSHPFHAANGWTPERMTYRGQQFYNIPLLYDIYQDVLIFKNTENVKYASQPIRPFQRQVSSFTVLDDKFRYIDEKVGQLSPGFFQVLYDGEDLTLLAKRVKRIKISAFSGESSYLKEDKYYVKIEDKYHRIYRKSSILNLFESHKKEIRKFIRENKIRVLKAEKDNQLVQLIKFCDDLI